MTKWWHLEKAWQLNGSWRELYVGVDDQGKIVETSDSPVGSSTRLGGYVLPGIPNGHSHAFQYAMAGLSEHLPQGAAGDDFWSWRQSMYQLALSLSPENVGAIARVLYAEMLRHGITSVAEFHYLHHDEKGKPYADLAEISVQLMAAAEEVGIRLTLIPVYYQTGGFNRPATEEQRRFIFRDPEHYQELVSAARGHAKKLCRVSIGTGIHSLRAGHPDDIASLLNQTTRTPKHIHIAEQTKEVEECKEVLGSRPVEWLLANTNVDHDFHLVHATHMTLAETLALANTNATVVICPSTEANLGDGFFPLVDYLEAQGSIAIGTDSHIGLSPWEDLRWLDYGVRLQKQRRNPLCGKGGADSAQILMANAWLGGMRSHGFHEVTPFGIGTDFDAIVLDRTHPTLAAKPEHRILSSVLFSGDVGIAKQIIAGGKVAIEKGAHPKMPAFLSQYQAQLGPTLARL